jgi:hypothetical protein
MVYRWLISPYYTAVVAGLLKPAETVKKKSLDGPPFFWDVNTI